MCFVLTEQVYLYYAAVSRQAPDTIKEDVMIQPIFNLSMERPVILSEAKNDSKGRFRET